MDYDGSKQRNHRDDKRERDRGKDRERERDRDRRRDDGRRSSHKHDDYEEDRDDKRRRRGGEGDTEERVVKVSSCIAIISINRLIFFVVCLYRNPGLMLKMDPSRRERSENAGVIFSSTRYRDLPLCHHII